MLDEAGALAATADKAWWLLAWAAALGLLAVACLVGLFVRDLMRGRPVDDTALRRGPKP